MLLVALAGLALVAAQAPDCDEEIEGIAQCGFANMEELKANMTAQKEEMKNAISACFVDSGCKDPVAAYMKVKECKKGVFIDKVGPALRACVSFDLPDDWLDNLYSKVKRIAKYGSGSSSSENEDEEEEEDESEGSSSNIEPGSVQPNSAESTEEIEEVEEPESSSSSIEPSSVQPNISSSAASEEEEEDGEESVSSSSSSESGESWQEKKLAMLEEKLAKYCVEVELQPARECVTEIINAKADTVGDWKARKAQFKAAKEGVWQSCMERASKACVAELRSRKTGMCQCAKKLQKDEGLIASVAQEVNACYVSAGVSPEEDGMIDALEEAVCKGDGSSSSSSEQQTP